jgi:hypothetical protein
MVGCYTDATNPRVRGGFYSLLKPANGRKKERKHMAEKNSGKHMTGTKSGNIWRKKYGANTSCENMAGIMRAKICTSFNKNTSVLQAIKHNMIGD